MADIRINALPTTATDFASDDYIAIDGTTNGTRKLNAKTANLTFSDVTLGTSGPSVKSTLSARAPRQGLVFDGSGYGTFSAIPAFGTGDFTYAAWIYVPATVTSYGPGLIGGGTNSFTLRVFNNFKLQSTLIDIADNAQSTSTVKAGAWNFVTYRRSGTSGYYGINGVEDAAITDSRNYSAGCTLVGQINVGYGTNYMWNGSIAGSLVYNRALSASEVVSLYEAGAPAGADYNSASNTSLVTGDNSTFASDTGFWTKTGTATIGSGVASLGTSGDSIYRNFTTSFRVGTKARATFTVGGAGSIKISNGTTADYTSGYTAGTYTVDFTIVQGSPADQSRIAFISIGSATLDNVTIFPLGLLLAPDAAQAGGGLTWYDTSGNAANITLPASGVSWNVPTSGRWGGNFGVGGGTTLTSFDTTYSASQVTGSLSLLGDNVAAIYGNNIYYNGGWKYSKASYVGLYVQNNAGIGDHAWYTAGSGSVGGAVSLTQALTLKNGGNFLIGTTIDGGQKLQVSGTGYFSSNLTVAGTTVGIGAAIGSGLDVILAGVDGYLYNRKNGYLIFGTNNTTALTLDNSQNATFAGSVRSSQLTLVGNRLEEYSTNADTSIAINYVGYNTGTTRFRDLQIYDGKASLVASFAGSTKQLTLYGPLQLANAYQAGAPTATGYVTIKDSNGTTYKVLVST